MTAPTGVGKGGAREGAGRPKGVAGINHKARELLAAAERDDLLTPLGFLLDVMRDPNTPRRERLQAAAIACPYMHPKLVAQVTAYIDPTKLSDEELLRTLRQLEAQLGEEPEPLLPVNDAPGAVIRPVSEVPAALHRPAPAPSDQRRLRYDPITKKMISVLQ